MFISIVLTLSILVLSCSLYLFSKSAEIRAKTRTEALYTFQITKQNESILTQINRISESSIQSEPLHNPIDNVEDRLVMDVQITNDQVEQEELLLNPATEITNETLLSIEDLKEVEIDSLSAAFLEKVNAKEDIHTLVDAVSEEEKTTQGSVELELQEQDTKNSWFNFKEVDLFLCDRPEKGLYYIAGKLIEKIDEYTAFIGDGTADRMFEHQKLSSYEEGDIIIAQISVSNHIWTVLNVWGINDESTYLTESSLGNTHVS
ncbi:hypothetical protein [Bacillus sp. AFS040349]|uniref:hypothetical protein n=1 Tax=Bacillus sp. AFS040349 TaxID=2033502 RepID=UPI000BFD1557|nr:hypothetical protein [Bacillus sp. AFS040349]PGT81501.1 hypothetical protein COD11_17370 [Bacillus sp. AFS040349]